MTTFHPGDRVIYVPLHAHGDPHHSDCEHGTVSSLGRVGNVFVKFDAQVKKLGWDQTTSQSCDADDLVLVSETIIRNLEKTV